MASMGGYSDIVSYLSSKKADVNIVGKWGTALCLSAKLGHEHIVKMLLHHGADLNMKSEEGWPSLEYAKAGEHHKIVKILENHIKALAGV